MYGLAEGEQEVEKADEAFVARSLVAPHRSRDRSGRRGILSTICRQVLQGIARHYLCQGGDIVRSQQQRAANYEDQVGVEGQHAVERAFVAGLPPPCGAGQEVSAGFRPGCARTEKVRVGANRSTNSKTE